MSLYFNFSLLLPCGLIFFNKNKSGSENRQKKKSKKRNLKKNSEALLLISKITTQCSLFLVKKYLIKFITKAVVLKKIQLYELLHLTLIITESILSFNMISHRGFAY